jgi:hypothetical protein
VAAVEDSKPALAVVVVAAEALVEIVAAVDLVAAEVEADSAVAAEAEEALVVVVVDGGASDTSPMVTVPPTALPLGLEAHERADLVVDVADSVLIEDQAAPLGMVVVMIDEVVAVATTEDQAVQTTSLWAVETDRAMVVERVGMAATTAHENVDTRATVTTIQGNEGGTELCRWLNVHLQGFVKVTSLSFASSFLVNEGKIRFSRLLTFGKTQVPLGIKGGKHG